MDVGVKHLSVHIYLVTSLGLYQVLQLSRATYFRPDAEQPWHLNFCRLESMDTSDRAT